MGSGKPAFELPPKSSWITTVRDETSDDEIDQTIDEKIAAARTRLSPSHCLFCSLESLDLADNLTHMSTAHSFFIPDADYLIDISGLISYLGEKIAVGNICIYCSGSSREFRTIEATRKHMTDKSHCKIAYDSPDDRLEISDYYDFTSSYPDASIRTRKEPKTVEEIESDDSDSWEDLEDEDEGRVVGIIDKDLFEDSSTQSDAGESLPDNQITYGDSHLELVLPSGARIGHRTMRKHHAQTFHGTAEDPNSGSALVRRLLADRNTALVARKGGFGAFGAGTDVVKAEIVVKREKLDDMCGVS
jgi:pre-60S factor REI1